jgi:hypothetical protein
MMKLVETMDVIKQQQDVDRAEREVIFREARLSRKRRLNPWDRESKRSKIRDPLFKRRLIEFYDCKDTSNTRKLFCQVLNRSYDSEVVIGSHIWKHETKGEGLDDFGIKMTEIDSPRNGLILCKGIEEAFDHLRVCFLYDMFNTRLVFHVADPLLMDKLVAPSSSLKFRDVDGRELRCPKNKLPYRRLLSWHAYCVMEKFGKLTDFQPFHRLSITEGGFRYPEESESDPLLAMVESGADVSDIDDAHSDEDSPRSIKKQKLTHNK